MMSGNMSFSEFCVFLPLGCGKFCRHMSILRQVTGMLSEVTTEQQERQIGKERLDLAAVRL
jgi:hypothetical protein